MDELPPGVTARRLRLLKTAAAEVSRIALLSTTPGRGGHEAQLADAERAARSLRLMVKPYRATSLKELEAGALAAISGDRMDGIANLQGAVYGSPTASSSWTSRRRTACPPSTSRRLLVEAGGLIAWAPDQEGQYR